MKAMGIVRKVDEFGRVVIPMELRRAMEIKEGTPVEVFASKDEITFRKYRPGCVFCDRVKEGMVEMHGTVICRECGTKIVQAMDGR